MLPGDQSPMGGTDERRNSTKGSATLKAAEEMLSACEPVGGGNTLPTGFISTQPLTAAAPLAEASQGPQCDLRKPTCPRCGLKVPEHRAPSLCPGLSQKQGPSLSVQSSKRSRRNVAASHQPTASPADSCIQLLLACLSCQGSVLLLGLLEACASCLHTPCFSCCHACTRCCAAIEDAPVEELNCHAHCHSVLFESCCEPNECLEFCLECSEICHRS